MPGPGERLYRKRIRGDEREGGVRMSTDASRDTRLEVPPAGTWNIDPGHSSITVTARHLMVSKVRGTLAFQGTVHIDEQPESSWVEVNIDAASVNTGNPQRDEHMRSADFLDVENHPTIEFRSTKTEVVGDFELAVHGDLIVRGTTRPVTLDVQYLGLFTDPWGNTRAGFTATTQVDREQWGMTWNQALETGGVLVGKTLDIELDIQAVKAQDQDQQQAS
jgi:polyisoprenoid-binding protein YceI